MNISHDSSGSSGRDFLFIILGPLHFIFNDNCVYRSGKRLFLRVHEYFNFVCPHEIFLTQSNQEKKTQCNKNSNTFNHRTTNGNKQKHAIMITIVPHRIDSKKHKKIHFFGIFDRKNWMRVRIINLFGTVFQRCFFQYYFAIF